MIESKPLPALAVTAFNAQINMVIGQTLEVMCLRAEDGWIVDLQNRVVTRTVADASDPAG